MLLFTYLFKPKLDVIKKLLPFAITGQLPDAFKILGSEPDSITSSGMVKDKNGSKKEGTFFTIYFEKLIDIVATDKSITFADRYSTKINMAAETHLFLQNFQTYFLDNHAIVSQPHINIYIYIDFLKTYNKKYNDFKDDVQRTLVSSQVEGFIQSQLSDVWVKLICYNIRQAVKDFDKLDINQLKTLLSNGKDFYDKGLGKSHFICFEYSNASTQTLRSRPCNPEIISSLETCASKTPILSKKLGDQPIVKNTL